MLKKKRRRSGRWKRVTPARLRPVRRRKRRRLTRKRVVSVLWMLFLGTLYLAGHWLYGYARGSGELAVREVRVEACGDIPLEMILSRAAVAKGKNILSINLQQLAKRLAEDPNVARVTVKKNPIRRMISIQVFPRVPVALVSGKRLWALDQEGVIVPLPASGKEDLPVVSGIPSAALALGKKEKTGRAQIALEVIDAFARTGLEPIMPLEEVNVSDLQRVVAYAGPDAAEIKLGSSPFLEKIKLARDVVEDLAKRRTSPRSIDTRYEHPVVVPRDYSTFAPGKEK